MRVRLPFACLAGWAGFSSCFDDVGTTASAAGAPSTTWFVDATRDWGLAFEHTTGARGEKHLPEVMAGGVALFDADGDGDLDLFVTNGHGGLPGHAGAGGPGHRFFRLEQGSYVDATEAAGLREEGYGMGVAVGDVDGDGDLDLYVANFGPDRLYLNRGDGTFEDGTARAGIDVGGWSSSAAFFDHDRDGWLDLYVARYVSFDPSQRCSDPAGRPDYCNPRSFPAEHDVLLRNRGDGTFEDRSEEAGLRAIPACAGLGVVCGDLDGDGWQDVYVANDSYPNQCWINQRDGTFRDDAALLGAAYNANGTSEAGMGVVAEDLDGDGDLDLFMTHLRGETNTLYRNRGGPAGFRDETGPSGLGTSSTPFTGFGVAALDVELDGDLDLVVLNGRVTRRDPLPGAPADEAWGPYAEPNLLYRNDGTGRFELAAELAPDLCQPVEVSRALATGDLDGDGDVDLVVVNAQGPLRVLLNVAPRAGHWLALRALEPAPAAVSAAAGPARWRDALGALVVVHAGGRRFARTVTGSGSYQSSRSFVAHFGLGAAARIDFVEVRWPDGEEEVFDLDGVDRYADLVRGAGRHRP